MSGRRIRLTVPVALLLGSCAGGDEIGNPVAPVELKLGAFSSDPMVVAIAEPAAVGSVIDQAWVSFGRFTFLSGSDCALLNDYSIEQPTLVVADLARPGTHIEAEVPVGSTCGIVVPLQAETDPLPGDAPAELATHSVVLRGERADGTPFLLTHPEQDELELLPEGGKLEVREGDPPLLLAFDVATWMATVDLDAGEVGEDGVVHIDAEQNPPLLDAFEEAAECSLMLVSDLDADGEVDPDDPLLARCAPDDPNEDESD